MKKIIYILIIIFLFSGMVFCGEEEARAGWYDGSWTYRKAVTVQSSKVETTETSFPVLVSVTNPDLRSTGNGGHVSQANGYDIIFSDDDGVALLDFEIESWDDETGEIQAWVETDISTTVDKTIYMYYGNSSATDISDAEGVWDDNYKGIWHLNENSGTAYDSTSNNEDLTETSGTIPAVSGMIGDARDFEYADTEYLTHVDGGSTDISGADQHITISAWVKYESFPEIYTYMVSKYDTTLNERQYALYTYDSDVGADKLNFIISPDGTALTGVQAGGVMAIDTWYYHVGVYDDATVKAYFNAIGGTPTVVATGIHAGAAAFLIGARLGNGLPARYIDGLIDEVRISNIARTAEWIETEYNNQSSPETFLAFGAEERDSYYLMASDNYKIEKDSINFGGMDDGQSANYNLKDTMGEIGTGFSESSTYQVNAGYRQMSETYISITSPTDVTMAPNIGGVSGGTGNGQAAWTVTTDSSGGYSLDIKASSTPAMQSGANSFANYTLAVAGTPDYTWSIAPAASEFGFTPEGNDIISKFKDNGADACNTGSNDTADKCWSNFSISYENIASSSDPNHPGGTATTVKFQAESGVSHLQEEGSYQATIIVTAVAL